MIFYNISSNFKKFGFLGCGLNILSNPKKRFKKSALKSFWAFLYHETKCKNFVFFILKRYYLIPCKIIIIIIIYNIYYFII